MIVVIINLIHLFWDILFRELRVALPAPEVTDEQMLFEFSKYEMGLA